MEGTDTITQYLFNWRSVLTAVAWGCIWAFLGWGAYRLVFSRVLRLIYGRIRLTPAEHAGRIGVPALLVALLIGINVSFGLLPGLPAALSKGADIALWIIVTVLCMRIVESLVIDGYLITHRGMKLPLLLRDIVKFLIYLTVFTTLFQQLYALNIGPLLTTSAVFTMVIGLALQDTLGNLFAGLATSIDQPYQLENWITVDGKERGRVVAITWRATTIETWKGDKITIPNNVLSKSHVLIHKWPLGYHKEEFHLRISSVVPARRVQQTLFEAVQDISYVEKTPTPTLEYGDFGDGYLTYILGVWIKDGTYPPVRTDVPTRLWYHLARENIAPGTSIAGTVGPPRPVEGTIPSADGVKDIVAILNQVDFLSPVSDADLEPLAVRIKIEPYTAGEILFHQGDEGSSFYLVKRGRVSIRVKDEQSADLVQVAILEEGAYFGEMSLLTGASRSATIQALTELEVLVITRDNFKLLLAADPTIAEMISQVIAERRLDTQAELVAARRAVAAEEAAQPSESVNREQHRFTLLNSIRSLFKLA